jgi:hypothetical protein
MTLKDVRNSLISIIFIFSILMALGSGPAQNILKITGAEVNQVLGVQKSSHQYYVAGKNTVIRAFLNKMVTIDENNTGVSVYKDGQFLFNMSPKVTQGLTTSVDFLCQSLEDCQNWAAGNYSFEMSVNGSDYSLNGPFVFREGNPLRVLAVPILANYGRGGIKSVTGNTWKQLGQFTQEVYPLAEDDMKWTNRLQYLDATSGKYNLETDPGRDNLTAALQNLIPSRCKTSPNAAGCYDYVVGMIPETVGGLEGWAPMDLPVVVVVAGSNDAAGTVAHEIAHKFGIGDTYDDAQGSSIRCSVNPAPNGFKGLNWDNNFVAFGGCTAGRPASTLAGADGSTLINGAMVPASSHPYDWNRGYLGEKADFMSAGGALQSQLWITPDNYDWLYRKLVLKDPVTMGKSNLLGEADGENRFINFSGTITKSGVVELDPWETYMDTATLEDTTGTYTFQALNNLNTVLASSEIIVHFFSIHPPKELDMVHFDGVANFPEGTSKFRIVKESELLKEVLVSASEPTVSNVTPLVSTTIEGLYNITWTANDHEGSTLTYTVSYNPDATDPESPWIILADGLQTSSWEEDFSLLPGGSHAKIQVAASDGVLSEYAQSAYFIVPPKAPEVYMGELPDEDFLDEDCGLTLSADVYDLQDKTFPQNKIRWTSSISGEIGTGPEILIKDLPVGVQTITVTATNSLGLTGSDSVTFDVTEDTSGNGGSGGGGLCFMSSAYSTSEWHYIKQAFKSISSWLGSIVSLIL